MYVDPVFEARKKSVLSGQARPPSPDGSKVQGSFIDSSFEKRRQQIISTPSKLVQTNNVQVEPPKSNQGLISTVKNTIKDFSLQDVAKSFVAGTKALPGMVKQAGGIIAGAWVGQQQSINSFFKKTPEPVKNILRSVSPQFQAFEKVQDAVEKIATKSVAPKALELREQGTKETQFARNEYQKNKQPSQGLQGLLEMVTYNLPQVAASTGLSLATAFVTKNPIAAATVGLSTSYGLGASEVYNQARSDGQSDKQALPLSMIGGAVIGAIDFLPLSKLLGKIGAVETVKKSLIKNIATNIVSIGTQAGFEGITEGLQEIIGNAVARTYNENQDLFEGVKESVIVGAILGGVTDVSLSTAIAVTGKGDVKATIQSIEKKVDEALSTPAEKRTPEQKMIAATILTQSLTPDDAMSFVLENDLGKTEIGKEIVKLVAQGKQQGKNLRMTPGTDGDSLDVTLVDPNQEQAIVTEEIQGTQNSVPSKKTDEELIAQYRKDFASEKLANTDNVREVYTDQGYNRINSAEFQDRASNLSTKIFEEDLNNLQANDEFLWTAGVSGGGKSTGLRMLSGLVEKAKGGIDGNFSSQKSLNKLKKVVDKKAHSTILFTYREPIDAWVNGVVKRALNPENGRVVPADVFLDNLINSPPTTLKAYELYGDTGLVDIKVVDNSHGQKKAVLVDDPIEFLKKIRYNKEDVKQEIIDYTKKGIKDGTIPEEKGIALLGKFSEGSSQKSQSKRGKQSNAPVKESSQTKEGIAPLPVGQGKPKQSKAYARVVDRLQEETRIDTTYNRLNLEEDAKKAVEFIETNPQEALRVALGIDPPPAGQTETAISIALADRAATEENFQLQSQLESARSLRQTRRGQEIVSERGRFNDESPYRYVQTLLDRRLREIGKGVIPTSTEEVQSILNKGESGSKKRAVEKVDRVAKELKTRLTKEQTKINLAQDIINSLIC